VRKVIRRRVPPKPPLTTDQILAWADSFHALHRRWPRRADGRIAGSLGENWRAIDLALSQGYRGLPGGTSLAKLLAEWRGHRHRFLLPRLTANGILAWADAHRRRTGAWPNKHSGQVTEAPGETWSGVDAALNFGWRGLRGGSSLARLLGRRRGRPNPSAKPPLTIEQILAWAEAYRTLFGAWPSKSSGPVGNRGETWWAIDSALRYGCRGLPGGSSLSQFLKGQSDNNTPSA
jgi:hypothetical protein